MWGLGFDVVMGLLFWWWEMRLVGGGVEGVGLG